MWMVAAFSSFRYAKLMPDAALDHLLIISSSRLQMNIQTESTNRRSCEGAPDRPVDETPLTTFNSALVVGDDNTSTRVALDRALNILETRRFMTRPPRLCSLLLDSPPDSISYARSNFFIACFLTISTSAHMDPVHSSSHSLAAVMISCLVIRYRSLSYS